jgi:hypothetical protein
MTWKVTPVSVGQSYLVGDPEEEDFVLVTTLGSPFSNPTEQSLWCTFHHDFSCAHIEKVKNP